MKKYFQEFDKQKEEKKEVDEKEVISLSSENFKKYFPLIKKFIENYKYILATIAGDPSLSYEPSTGETFEFHPKEGKIYLSARQWEWAEKLGLNQEQILWSTLHEIAHFQDLMEDPEGMLGLFDYLENKAKEMAPYVLEHWKKYFKNGLPGYLTELIPVDPENPEKKMSFVEIFLYKQYHMFYNCLDDIYVNRLVGIYNSPFSPGGSKAEQVKILYRDYLFPSKFEEIIDPLTGKKDKIPIIGQPPEEGDKYDLTSLPLSNQFALYLLRKYMVPDQEIIVSKEVEEALNRQTDKIGKRSVIEEVNNITRPTGRYEKIKHLAGWRYKQIQKFIEPIFTELFLKDIEKLPPPLLVIDWTSKGESPSITPEKFEWQPGMKVKDKKTGHKGIITRVFSDGKVEVEFIKKEKEN